MHNAKVVGAVGFVFDTYLARDTRIRNLKLSHYQLLD